MSLPNHISVNMAPVAPPVHRFRFLPIVLVWAMVGMIPAVPAIAVPATATQETVFDYQPQTGVLVKEVVEPGDSSLCAAMAYGYDAWGNRNAITKRNCNGSAGLFPGSGTATNQEASAPAAGSRALFTQRITSTVHTYNANGSLTVVRTNGAGEVETLTYNAGQGQLVKLQSANGVVTEWAYDAMGRRVLEKNADGTGTRWAHAWCSGVNAGTAACPAIGGSTPVRMVTTTPLRGTLDLANPATGGDANGAVTKVYYDALARVLRTETQGFDGTPIYEDTTYNNQGMIATASRPYFSGQAVNVTSHAYDKLGRVIQTTLPDGTTSSTVYVGPVSTFTNSLAQSTTSTRNDIGQLISVKDANDKTLTYSYDALGNLSQVTDSTGNVVKAEYDLRSRKTALQDPDMGSWTYAYNGAGELVWQKDAKNQETSISYDQAGRVSAKIEPSLNSNWYYGVYADGSACSNGKGQLCEATSSNNYSRKRFYDAVARLTKTTVKLGSKSYDTSWTYANGRPATTRYPSGALALENVYNDRGYLERIVNAANTSSIYWKATARDASLRLLQQTYGNAVTSTNTYDPQTGRLKTTVAGPGNAIQNIAYTYDTLGNLKTRNDAISGVNASYIYHPKLNRLETETRSGGGLGSPQTITWDYDDIGNIKSRSDVGVYTYNPSGGASVRPHAVASISGMVNGVASPAYAYDANGNMTGITTPANVRVVAWTSFNMVDTITQTGGGNTNKLAYVYNPELNRVQEAYTRNNVLQRTSTYLNLAAGEALLYEEDVNHISGVTKKKHYLDAAGRTIGVLTLNGSVWETQYWHQDRLGSPMAITNAAGALVEQLAYEPYGKRRHASGGTDAAGTLTSSSTDRGYTQHEMMDEVALVNMNGRIYDPAIGRFLSADPYVPGEAMQSLNRYTYVNNNPLNGIDPSGFSSFGDPATFNPISGQWQLPTITVSGLEGAGITGGPGGSIGYRAFEGLTPLGAPGLSSYTPMPTSFGRVPAVPMGGPVFAIAGTWADTNRILMGWLRSGPRGEQFQEMLRRSTHQLRELPQGLLLDLGMTFLRGLFAEADEGADHPDGEKPPERKTNPSKQESPIWNDLDRAKDGLRTSGSGSKQRYYDWDYTHDDIEVYDRNRRHLGSMDPTTGEMYKPPVPGRKIGKP